MSKIKKKKQRQSDEQKISTLLERVKSLSILKKKLLLLLSLKMGRRKTKKLTDLEIPNLVYKLPFRWRCARCLLQRSKTNGDPAGGPHNLKSSEVLYRLLSKFGTMFHWNTGVLIWYCLKIRVTLGTPKSSSKIKNQWGPRWGPPYS